MPAQPAKIGLVGLAVTLVVAPFVWVGNRLGNRGPMLFRQERAGKGGETFTILKFRTMRAGDASDTTSWTRPDDPRVTAFGRNAAVRIRFTDDQPVEWHPASLADSGHVVGVDAGCVCIVDYVGYASMSRRSKAAALTAFFAETRPCAMTFDLASGGIGVATDSGYGDGNYPVYWGVDSEGRIAQLVVDFMVLVNQDDDGALTTL